MEHHGVVITAGFDKSRSAIGIAELLRRRGIPVKGFVVVSPYSLTRLRKYIKKRGWTFLLEAVPRLLGNTKINSDQSKDCLGEFLDKKRVSFSSIKRWTSHFNIDYLSVNTINDSKVVEYLAIESPQWLIYSGGGILKDNIINSMNGRILNAHQGPLPEIRGMNAAEWSILLEEKQETTIHLIDEGIDTGKIITSLSYLIKENDTINCIRDKAKIKGIEGLVEVASKSGLDGYNLKENSSDYRQCYILSSAMKELLRKKLQNFQEELV
jgi:folate-dependent phosphoribosylglycinamide formyltransferase PurN